MDWYKLEYAFWSKGFNARTRYALQTWTPEQRAAYDDGYDAGERNRAQPGISKPYGWRGRNHAHATRLP